MLGIWAGHIAILYLFIYRQSSERVSDINIRLGNCNPKRLCELTSSLNLFPIFVYSGLLNMSDSSMHCLRFPLYNSNNIML